MAVKLLYSGTMDLCLRWMIRSHTGGIAYLIERLTYGAKISNAARR